MKIGSIEELLQADGGEYGPVGEVCRDAVDACKSAATEGCAEGDLDDLWATTNSIHLACDEGIIGRDLAVELSRRAARTFLGEQVGKPGEK